MIHYNDRQRELLEEREKLSIRIKAINQEIRDCCEHQWSLSQIAGDGYTCVKCGAWMPED